MVMQLNIIDRHNDLKFFILFFIIAVSSLTYFEVKICDFQDLI